MRKERPAAHGTQPGVLYGAPCGLPRGDVVLVTIFVALMWFMFHISGWIFALASFAFGIGGVAVLISGNTFNGVALLIMGFLVSPFDLPMLAVHFTAGMQKVNYKLRDFIAS